MTTPQFIYHPLTPPEYVPTKFDVFSEAAPDVDAYLGRVYQTADKAWTAEWRTNGNDSAGIAIPGFGSRSQAAFALYWYAPPTQSVRSRPIGQTTPVSDWRSLDTSQCGCCMDRNCDCEGLDRVSQRFGTTQSYEVQPSLIPEHGVLISLAPINDGDFLVDLNTRGAGSGIGYLQQRDDGTYDTRLGSIHVGIATTPEAGLWAVIALHTTHKRYAPMLKGFTPSEDQIRIEHPAVSVLLPTIEEETA